MRAGALRHRVTFQTLTLTQDDYGGMVQAWLPVVDSTDPAYNATAFNAATVWAEVNFLSGREYWDAQKANSEAQGRVKIRHRSDIVPTMRIVYGSKILHILAPFTYDTKNQEMHILFKEALD
jgi:SPP1 family predicted phage head-tail adaptor